MPAMVGRRRDGAAIAGFDLPVRTRPSARTYYIAARVWDKWRAAESSEPGRYPARRVYLREPRGRNGRTAVAAFCHQICTIGRSGWLLEDGRSRTNGCALRND